MRVRLARKRDAQFVGVGPVQLQRAPRLPILGKKDLLVRPMRQAPQLDPTLKRPQMLFLHGPRRTLPQMFKQRLGLQIRGLRQQRLGLRPNLHQRIFACSPMVLGL